MSVSGRSVLALLVGVMLCFEIAQATYEHRPAFETFCSLIRLTESKVEIPATVKLPKELETDLIKLNMTTADDAWYDVFSGQEADTWDKVKDKEPFKTWAAKDRDLERMYGKWNTAKKELLADATKDGKKEFLRPPAGPRRLIASARIRSLLARYHKIRLEHEGEVIKLQNLASEIEKKFREALTGDANAKNVTGASFGDQRGGGNYACGRASTPSDAGKSLANDLTCICTSTTSTHANTKCHTDLTGSSSSINAIAWTSDNGAKAKEGYDLVYAQCPPAPTGLNPTAHTLQRLLTKFWGLLGKGGHSDGSTATTYTIGGGTSATANTCTGSNANTVCVTYTANLNSATPNGIPWLKALEDALEKLETLEAEEKRLHTLNARAATLVEAAWTAYDEANLPDAAGVANEIPATAAKAAKPTTTTPGANVSNEQRSIATIPLFILPWTLLV